jgi:hypothetical protein
MPARSGLNSRPASKSYVHLCVYWPELLPESYTLVMIPRPARSRQRGIATSELAISSVLLLIIGVFVVRSVSSRREPTMACLGILASAADGKPASGATCPVSEAPYAVTRNEGRETVACSDPKGHLQFTPWVERTADGPWRLQQKLPPAGSGSEVEVGRSGSTVRGTTRGSLTIVDVRPRFWLRWFVGPIFHLLALVYVVSLPFQLHPKSGNPTSVKVVCVVGALASAWFLWVSVPLVEGSESLEFDSARRRVTHRRFVFGVERAPLVYDDCEGVCFVRSAKGLLSDRSLVLFSRSAGGRTVTPLVDDL